MGVGHFKVRKLSTPSFGISSLQKTRDIKILHDFLDQLQADREIFAPGIDGLVPSGPLAVIFQLQTGMRIGEICTAQFGDVDQDYFHVQRMQRRDLKEVVEHSKTECCDRNVYLTQTAKEVISAARNRLEELGINHEYIFSIQPGQPLPERPIADLYEKYCRKLGVECKSSHKARKTVISAWVDNNVNINTARQMAGHASERTTLKNYVYDRSSEDEKHAVLESAVSY